MRFKGFFNKGVFLKWNQFSWILVSSTRMTWHWLSAIAGKVVSMLLDAYFRKDDGRDDTTPRDTLSPTVTSRRPRLSETGRSMMEMLGVLAIVGVLSIAGIAGYRYAMDKSRANETIDELNKRAVVYATQVLNNEIRSGETLSNGEFGDKTALDYDIEAKKSYYPDEFEVTLTNYPSEVCRDILKNYTIPYQIIVSGKVYDPRSDNYSICGEDGETAPETLFVYTADLNQEKEGFEEEETTFFDGEACTPREEFSSGGRCYPCDSSGSYYIYSQYEYELCRACGRRMVVENFCVPGCMAGQVYHADKKECVTPECVTNRDCGIDSGEYCQLDSKQNNSSCTEAPTYGTCESASGTPVTVTGVGTYQKSGSKMNWWSAQNYCEAIGGRMATVADFGCGYDYVSAGETGYCNTDTTTSKNGTLSANMVAFQKAFDESGSYWTSDSRSACGSYLVYLGDGLVDHYYRGSDPSASYALCRVGD